MNWGQENSPLNKYLDKVAKRQLRKRQWYNLSTLNQPFITDNGRSVKH